VGKPSTIFIVLGKYSRICFNEKSHTSSNRDAIKEQNIIAKKDFRYYAFAYVLKEVHPFMIKEITEMPKSLYYAKKMSNVRI